MLTKFRYLLTKLMIARISFKNFHSTLIAQSAFTTVELPRSQSYANIDTVDLVTTGIAAWHDDSGLPITVPICH